jgi:N-acetylglucosamine-6-phosphate deacetylase
MAGDSWRIHGNLIWPDGGIRPGTVTVAGGLIASVDEAGASPEGSDRHTLRGALVGPGFIDLHMHGAVGADFMSGSAADAHRIAEFAVRHGVTGIVASAVTAGRAAIADALRAIATAMREQDEATSRGQAPTEARLLGANLEGPYLSQARRGGQDPATIRPADIGEYAEWAEIAPIRLITLAPEQQGVPELIEYIVRTSPDTVLSAGHTDASYEQTRRGIDMGIRHFTHFLCGMSGFHHRAPGAVGAGLLCETATVELIADLVHVHPSALRMVAEVRGPDKVTLVTDSVNFCGMPDGTYPKRGREYRVADNSVRLPDGTLAGSVLTMNIAVKNMAEAGVGIASAWQMASAVPAAVLGLSSRAGSLAPGRPADIAVLDEQFAPRYTMVRGQLAYDGTREGPEEQS